ncbi:ABC transporter permease [Rudanella lutea]|uniref:ABC transporter permease n=1 Tax=Rudanella lutea TaxID=451374 RepID=UPI00036D447F|nr:FtsX-like permease family protein [Rudanella lutea]
MNVPFFLARRIRQAPIESFSATVTKVGIASIAVGLAVMIVAFAVLFGFKQTIQEKIFLFGAHLQVSKFTANQSYEEAPISTNTRFFREVQSNPGIAHVQAVALKAGILKTPDELAGVVLKGVGTDYNWQLIEQSLVAGRVPAIGTDSARVATGRADTTAGYSTEILLSQFLADQLKLKVGESVITYFLGGSQPRPRKLTVVGIYMTGLEEFDKQIVLGDLRLIQRLNNWTPDMVGSFELFVRDFDRLDATFRTVFDQIPPDFRLFKVTDQYGPLFDWMVLLDRNTLVFLILILFVASFNMVSVLLVLMMERTPMIGLLKALGSQNTLLRRMFLYVGLNMVGWGLLIGNAVGLGFCFVQDYFKLIPLDPKNYFMSFVPIQWDWGVIGLLNAATLVLIAAVLWIPTLVINRIEPVRALVFKK